MSLVYVRPAPSKTTATLACTPARKVTRMAKALRLRRECFTDALAGKLGQKVNPPTPSSPSAAFLRRRPPTLSPSQLFPGPWEGQLHVGSAPGHLECYGPRNGGVGVGWQGRVE
ncbi:hypothetical protein PAL_GLEAN10021190 [Pteropus alecto]|uniref:Uncharacterized protein n=1 Tax=Pteropus alecto TaxID=9402 RepID=L5KT46_PTEAL|nr:hypothetical protein PAL_GLEAN10021190 [Pteropus alecto]